MSVLLRHPSNGSEQTVEDDLADYLVAQGWTRVHDAYVQRVASVGPVLNTPHAAAITITGDLDVRVKARPDDWTPAATMAFVAKDGSPGNRGWSFRLNTSGTLNFEASVDGTATVSDSSSVAVPFADGTDGWVRVTYQASNREVKFYTSTNGVTWAQLGITEDLTGITALFASTAPLDIGSRNVISNPFSGRIYFVSVHSGIDGLPVLSCDFDSAVGSAMHLDPSGGTFTDMLGKVWTRTGTGSEIKIVAPPRLDEFDTSGYMPATGLYSPGAQRALIHKLRSGVEPAACVVFSDSTALDPDEWFVRLGDWLGAQFPKYTVTNVGWSDALQCWEPSLHGSAWQRQVGSAGDAYAEGFASGNWLQSPHATAPQLLGSMEIRVKAMMPDWSPGSASSALTAKYGGAANRGWRLYLTPSGNVTFEVSTDGTALSAAASSAAVPFADGTTGWVRVVFFASTGLTTFHTSTDGVNWTQLGTGQTIPGSPLTLFNSTAPAEIGGRTNGSEPFLGCIHYVEWRTTGGAVVLAVDFDQAVGSDAQITASGGTFTDLTGRVWTRTGSAIKIKGSPGLTLFNGAVTPGGILTYFNDGTRGPKLRAIQAPDLMFISIGHEDGGSSIRTAYKTLADACIAAWPDVSIVAVVQSPQAPSRTAQQIAEHTIRQRQVASLASFQGYGIVDHHYAFSADRRGLPALVSGNGIEPTTAGKDLTTEVAKAFFAPWVKQTRRETPAAKLVTDLPTSNIFYAHRGGGSAAGSNTSPVAPENSMSAFQKAFELGAHIIDVDSVLTADGVPVAMHDLTVDRTTTNTGTVASYLAKDLPPIYMPRKIGTGWAPEPVPTIDQILDRFGGRVVLDIEPKNGVSGVQPLIDLIVARGLQNSVMINVPIGSQVTMGAAVIAAGIKLHVFGLTTVQHVTDCDAAGAWMVDLPYNVASDRITAVQAATSIKRVITAPLWRRLHNEARTAGFQGAESDAVGYLERIVNKNHIAQEIQDQKVGVGWFAAGVDAPHEVFGPNGLWLSREGLGQRQWRLGSLCGPKPATYSIELTVRFGAFNSGNDRPQFRACCPSDEGDNNDGNTRGYTFSIRQNGALVMWSGPVGYGGGVSLGTTTTKALSVNGEEVSLRFDVTPTHVSLTRLDTGHMIGPIANTEWRGDYVWVGNLSATRDYLLKSYKIITP